MHILYIPETNITLIEHRCVMLGRLKIYIAQCLYTSKYYSILFFFISILHKITMFNPLTAAGLYIDILSILQTPNNYVNLFIFYYCVDYIYKLKFYLLNTTLIYKYNLHIIVENK